MARKRPEISIPKGLVIGVRCRDCSHFNGVPHTALKTRCSELGVLGAAQPCKYFAMDIASVNMEDGHASKISKIVKTLNSRSLVQLAAVLNAEHITRKAGFSFGEEVYFALGDPNYIGSYVRGKLVRVARNNAYIRCGQTTLQLMLDQPGRIMAKDDWRKTYKKLRKLSKWVSPHRGWDLGVSLRDMQAEGYVPPWVSTIRSPWKLIEDAAPARASKTPANKTADKNANKKTGGRVKSIRLRGGKS